MEFDEDTGEPIKVRPVQVPEAVPARLKVDAWSAAFNDAALFFHAYLLKDSYFIWIGSNPAHLTNLNVAMMTPYVRLPPPLGPRPPFLPSLIPPPPRFDRFIIL